MRQETFTLSQKELQRVSVISTCIKAVLHRFQISLGMKDARDPNLHWLATPIPFDSEADDSGVVDGADVAFFNRTEKNEEKTGS